MSSSVGKDYPIYEMENKIHIPNHQPDNASTNGTIVVDKIVHGDYWDLQGAYS